MLSASEALSLLAVVTSVAAAIFLSRAASRPGREELHHLGAGNIVEGGASSLLFGIRSALVQSALTQWVSHVVGVGLLCFSIAVQMAAMALSKSAWHVPTSPCMIIELAIGLTIWQAGSELVRTLSARTIMSAVRSEVRFWRSRSPGVVAKLARGTERDELGVHIGRLLAGLVSAERARQFADGILSDLECPTDNAGDSR